MRALLIVTAAAWLIGGTAWTTKGSMENGSAWWQTDK